MDALTPVAKSFKGKVCHFYPNSIIINIIYQLLVVHVDSKDEETGRVMEFFSITEDDVRL